MPAPERTGRSGPRPRLGHSGAVNASVADNPILTSLERNGRVESLHRGAWVLVELVDGEPRRVASAGDPDQAVFARSAMKGLQALPVVETGAADAFGLSERELAVACSSHSAEPQHVRTVAAMLARAGLDEHHLRCGPAAEWGSGPTGPRRPIYHNCSGKHAAMLLTACHLGVDPAAYLVPESLNQKQARSAVADLTGADLEPAIDGCSAPTFRLPLAALATGIARLTSPHHLAPARSAACRRITAAVAAYPEMIGGSVERADTDLIAATDGRIFAKLGAEGMFVCGVVDANHALAITIDDGNPRGFHALALHLLHRYGMLDGDELARLDHWARLDIRNPAGRVTGVQRLHALGHDGGR